MTGANRHLVAYREHVLDLGREAVTPEKWIAYISQPGVDRDREYHECIKVLRRWDAVFGEPIVPNRPPVGGGV